MTTSIIAVPQARGDSLGAITYWSLQRTPIPRELLKECIIALGLSEKRLPVAPTTKVLLARACQHAAGVKYIVKSKAGFVHVLDEQASGADDKLLMASAATYALDVDDQGVTFVKVIRDTIDMSHRIVDGYKNAMNSYTSEDISAWLTGEAELHAAVRMRSSGGVYFIPEPKQEAWSKLTEALASISQHVVYKIPALRVDSATDAVIDALVAECEQCLDEVVDFIGAADQPSNRSLTARMKRIDSMRDKVALYEGTIDRNLTAMQDKLARLKGVVGDQMNTVNSAEAIARMS